MPRPTLKSLLLIAWSAGGVALLLIQAIVRLLPRAMEALAAPSAGELLAYAACVGFLGYTEGYKAFHLRFMPRVAARSLALARDPKLLRVLLAPAYAMALFAAPRRRLIASWVVTLGVVALIVVVQRLPMPWRGMIDGGVVLSLAWGVLRLAQLLAQAVRGTLAPIDPELPA